MLLLFHELIIIIFIQIFCNVSSIAIVVYQLFFKMVLGQSFSWDFIFEFLVKNSLGAYVDCSYLPILE